MPAGNYALVVPFHAPRDWWVLRTMAACMLSGQSAGTRPLPHSRRESRILGASGEMVLRVDGRGHQGREIRIRSPKCTIGSAPGCTLRLIAPGVGLLQCWILRGRNYTIVRRLHGSATLNGRQFEESPLKIGDRLRMGVVELEVIELSSPGPQSPPEIFPPAFSDLQGMSNLQSELSDAQDQIKR